MPKGDMYSVEFLTIYRTDGKSDYWRGPVYFRYSDNHFFVREPATNAWRIDTIYPADKVVKVNYTNTYEKGKDA